MYTSILHDNFATHASQIYGTAKCDAGDFVVNGGYRDVSGVESIYLDKALLGETGLSSPPYGGWEILAAGPFLITIDVTAVCFDNSPVQPIFLNFFYFFF